MFFAAAFKGANDVAYVYEAGVPEALMVDIDGTNFGEMREQYPERPEWEYVEADAYELAAGLASSGRAFDLVVCDPFTGGLMERVTFGTLPDFLAIARTDLVIGLAGTMLAAHGVSTEPTPEEIGAALSKAHGTPIACRELVRRSDNAGGVWWAVLAGQANPR